MRRGKAEYTGGMHYRLEHRWHTSLFAPCHIGETSTPQCEHDLATSSAAAVGVSRKRSSRVALRSSANDSVVASAL